MHEHVTEVERQATGLYIVTCSCGWESTPCHDRTRAEEEADNHARGDEPDVVRAPAT